MKFMNMRLMPETNNANLDKELARLSQKAFRDSAKIAEIYGNSFGHGNFEIPVYHVKRPNGYHSYATFTINGVFKYYDNICGGREYQFSCSPEGIYKMLVSCYLRRNNLEHLANEKFDCKINNIDNYFHEFVKML